MECSLGYALKRKGIKQTDFREALRDKYKLSLSQPVVNRYCLNVGVRNTDNWNTIRLCAKQEFGLEYRNSRWWEVTNNG